MKKLIFSVLSIMLLSCFSGFTQDNKMKTKDGKTKVKMEHTSTKDFPYQATYSSQFVISNPDHAKKILEIWKDYDENNLTRHADYFADSVTIDFPNGMSIKGKDAAMKAITDYRTSQGKVESVVDAWIATKSVDKGDEWVCVWGVETATDAAGKVTKNRLHEIWQLNKDGKVVYMAQYTATPPAM
ncbi:MAG TPA: nuclear transport factor 2 family protein [Chitinophagaceae bacterium]|nr:nuclear transport factor 2 family protein [Chitinophagaceae bacterium]